jgi:hypothetical protein
MMEVSNSWQLDSVGDESGRRVSELGQTTPKTFIITVLVLWTVLLLRGPRFVIEPVYNRNIFNPHFNCFTCFNVLTCALITHNPMMEGGVCVVQNNKISVVLKGHL